MLKANKLEHGKGQRKITDEEEQKDEEVKGIEGEAENEAEVD
jgi:hypothetical protein